MCNGKRNCLNSDDETQECSQFLISNQNKDPSKLRIFTINVMIKVLEQLFDRTELFYYF